MRYTDITENTFFRVWNTGAGGSDVFLDSEDSVRFVFYITHLVSPANVFNTHWYISTFLKKKEFRIGKNKIDDIYNRKEVDLIAFSIHKKGFDLLIRNISMGSASVYMQRVQTAYAKYFNSKYKRRGHVFNGPFCIRKVLKNDIVEASLQIHSGTDSDICISSKDDYISKNRWNKLLQQEPILKIVGSPNKYNVMLEKFSTKDGLRVSP